jgi:uncharacterized protein (DUF1499 family)
MVDDWSRDWTENTAITSVDAKDPWLRPGQLAMTPREVAERLERWATGASAWEVVSRESDGPVEHLHLVHKTRLWRFRDDVHVKIEPMEEEDNPDAALSGVEQAGAARNGGAEMRARVSAKSASRIGKGDLGQNPRNLRELMRAVAALAP